MKKKSLIANSKRFLQNGAVGMKGGDKLPLICPASQVCRKSSPYIRSPDPIF